MVRHVIMWNFKDGFSAEENAANAALLKEKLLALKGEIDDVVDIQVYTAPLSTSNKDMMLDSTFADEAALARYQAQRKAHVRLYQFWSRWLTPVFQSERDWIARSRDLLFKPMARMPGGRGHMLRVLSGTQHGLFGKLPLAPEFVAALAGPTPLLR